MNIAIIKIILPKVDNSWVKPFDNPQIANADTVSKRILKNGWLGSVIVSIKDTPKIAIIPRKAIAIALCIL